MDEVVEAVLLRAMDSDLKDSVPPDAAGPSVQTKSAPRFLSITAKRSASLVQPEEDNFISVHTKVSLAFSSFTLSHSARFEAVSDKSSSFLHSQRP